MTEHLTDHELSDWVEDLLSDRERAEVAAHLEACGECRRRAQGVREVVTELGGLPTEARAPESLWQGIEARIGRKAREAPDVVPLPTARRATGVGRRISFSLGQLLAAGIVLAALSGSAVWMALSQGSSLPVARQVESPGGGPSGVLRTAAATRGAIADYEAATADLEAMVEEGRAVLKPETVDVLEESLRTIDSAIGEAREALSIDPASEVLYRLLARNMKRKLDMLRSAAQAINAAS